MGTQGRKKAEVTAGDRAPEQGAQQDCKGVYSPWGCKSWLYFLTKGCCRVEIERRAGIDTSATNVSPGLQGEGQYREGGYLRWEQDIAFSLPSPDPFNSPNLAMVGLASILAWGEWGLSVDQSEKKKRVKNNSLKFWQRGRRWLNTLRLQEFAYKIINCHNENNFTYRVIWHLRE